MTLVWGEWRWSWSVCVGGSAERDRPEGACRNSAVRPGGGTFPDEWWQTSVSSLWQSGPQPKGDALEYFYRITEWLRFEKTSKIMSNYQPSTTMCSPLIHVLECLIHTVFLSTSRHGDLCHPEQSVPMLDSPFHEKVFLISKLNVLWCSLRSFSLVLSLVTLSLIHI